MSSRRTIIIIGAVAGALLGASSAWAFTKAREQRALTAGPNARQLSVKAGVPDLVRIGVAILGLVRQITDLVR